MLFVTFSPTSITKYKSQGESDFGYENFDKKKCLVKAQIFVFSCNWLINLQLSTFTNIRASVLLTNKKSKCSLRTAVVNSYNFSLVAQAKFSAKSNSYKLHLQLSICINIWAALTKKHHQMFIYNSCCLQLLKNT